MNTGLINFGIKFNAAANIRRTTREIVMKTDTSKGFKVTTTVEVTEEQIRNLLCCAFEGGSNYWYMIDDFGNPDNLECEFRHLDLPLSENGYLMISDKEDEGDEDGQPTLYRLDRASLMMGIQRLAEKVPHQFKRVLDDTEDADTGDCFLQCCVFGDVILG